MTLRFPAIALCVAVSLGLGACAEATPRHHPRVAVAVDLRPPAPRVVVVPAARRGYVWARG
jgi:hypothetical protein